MFENTLLIKTWERREIYSNLTNLKQLYHINWLVEIALIQHFIHGNIHLTYQIWQEGEKIQTELII
jgi:hypothetical protein